MTSRSSSAAERNSELGSRADLRVGSHRVVEALALHHPARHLDVLALHRGHDVAGCEPARAQLVALQPDSNRPVPTPEEQHSRHARYRLHPRLDVVTDVLAGVDDLALGSDRHPQHRLVAEILFQHDRRLDVPRQETARLGDLVAHVLGRHVDVDAQLELGPDHRDALGRLALQRTHPGDGVDVLLEDVGDVLLHHLRARALEGGHHRHHREVHGRELIDAEPRVAEHAEDDQRGDQHPGEDGPPDEKVEAAHGTFAGSPALPATAGSG
jgi:hypothetical protein